MGNYGFISHLAQICEQCGRQYLPKDTGRPQRYCSGACRQRAYRVRRLLDRVECLLGDFRNVATGPGVNQ